MTGSTEPGTARNLVEMFFARAAAMGAAPFLHDKAAGAWRAWSWADAAHDLARLAEALRAAGLGEGERVMIVAENRPEWVIADLAIMAAGCITVPAYTTNTIDDHAHILADSGAAAAIVSNAALAKALFAAIARSAACQTVIAMTPIEARDGVAPLDWRALLAAQTGDVAAAAAEARFAREDLACVIYTSGTGGAPRGVRQHHGAILHNCAAAADIVQTDFGLDDEVFLSLLPLSHAYEHTAGLHFAIAIGAQIYFAESIERLSANIREVRPTIMIVVPRLFELMRARILKQVQQKGRLARWLLDRALALDAAPRRTLLRWPLDRLLDQTLRRQVRAQFGGRIKALVSGGAPLNPEVGRFFRALGLTLLQGYGQTEAAPLIAVNRPAAGIALETVGPPVRDCAVRIADDGEILVRGENVMHGYWNNAAESARVLVDGWLHTGDVGHVDRNGRLVITDRKKDLIVNDKGDNISPQRLEGLLTLQPEIAQAMVAGDRRPYLVALIVPDAAWAANLGQAEVERGIQLAIDRVNATLSVIERVRRFVVADAPFTIEDGSITPSLKLRRHILRQRYGERLDALYRR